MTQNFDNLAPVRSHGCHIKGILLHSVADVTVYRNGEVRPWHSWGGLTWGSFPANFLC